MSLYNKLFGENKDAMALLGMIDLTRNDFQRYRDIWLNKSGTIITVLARIGGNNRKDYKQVFSNVRKNKWFVKDFDDDFDDTYAYFQFKIPEKYQHTCKLIAPKEERLSLKEMFEKETNEAKIPGTEAYKRMIEIADEIMKNIEDGNPFIGL